MLSQRCELPVPGSVPSRVSEMKAPGSWSQLRRLPPSEGKTLALGTRHGTRSFQDTLFFLIGWPLHNIFQQPFPRRPISFRDSLPSSLGPQHIPQSSVSSSSGTANAAGLKTKQKEVGFEWNTRPPQGNFFRACEHSYTAHTWP